MNKPTQIQNADFTELTEAVKDYIDFLEDEDACEDDLGNYRHDIFEKAVKAIYGNKAFDYVNKKIDEFE